MTLLSEISNPYLGSLILGMLYGLTLCTSVCLPYVIGYIAGIGAGFRKGVMVTSIYNSGRVTAYALIGGLAGLFRTLVSDAFFLSYQKYSPIAFGVAIIIIGASIFLRKKSSIGTCIIEKREHLGIPKKLTQKFDIRAFSMGFTRGLVLCPPLIALLLAALALSQINIIMLAVLFGLGTAVSPLIILGGATGWLLNKAPLFSRWISKISAGILIMLGLDVLLNVIIHL
ncbi:MAG: sulfite exporter TauE/SafE family protein [Candidatus Bathyarchaeota archaeon]|nr:sulfite exporter TauE/SafE family protein [Candidatus Bathyarchaeota archaeon]